MLLYIHANDEMTTITAFLVWFSEFYMLKIKNERPLLPLGCIEGQSSCAST